MNRSIYSRDPIGYYRIASSISLKKISPLKVVDPTLPSAGNLDGRISPWPCIPIYMGRSNDNLPRVVDFDMIGHALAKYGTFNNFVISPRNFHINFITMIAQQTLNIRYAFILLLGDLSPDMSSSCSRNSISASDFKKVIPFVLLLLLNNYWQQFSGFCPICDALRLSHMSTPATLTSSLILQCYRRKDRFSEAGMSFSNYGLSAAMCARDEDKSKSLLRDLLSMPYL